MQTRYNLSSNLNYPHTWEISVPLEVISEMLQDEDYAHFYEAHMKFKETIGKEKYLEIKNIIESEEAGKVFFAHIEQISWFGKTYGCLDDFSEESKAVFKESKRLLYQSLKKEFEEDE